MGIESGKLATGAAIVISSAAIVSSLIFVARMNSEITELYRTCMDDMQEFNKLTNDAWTEMQVMEGNEPIVRDVKQRPFASFFRSSRQAGLPSQCNCGLQPNNCPRGPAGEKGRPGFDGEPGTPGLVGTPGMSGAALGEEMYPHSCIQCPAGERGPQGPKGRTGPIGPPGSDGENAPPVAAGQPDEPPGEVGEKGADGLPGPSGNPGVDGEDGIKYLDSPAGEKDKPSGEIGEAGDVGLPGEDGQSEAGPPGDEGPQGLAGIPGARGAAGEQGSIGLPGQDGSYCPCPSRSSIVQPAEAKETFEAPAEEYKTTNETQKPASEPEKPAVEEEKSTTEESKPASDEYKTPTENEPSAVAEQEKLYTKMEVDSTPKDVETTSQSNSSSNSKPNRSTSQRHQRAVMSGMALLLQQMRSTANETKTTTVTKENVVVEEAPEKLKRILPPKSKVEYSQLSSERRGDLQLTASQIVSKCFHENTTPKFGFHPKCPENNYVRSCKFSPKGDFLVCDSEDRMVRIFNVVDNKLEFRKSLRQGALVYNLSWDPFGDWIATTSGGDTPIQFWSVDGELYASYLGINHLDQVESAYSMAFNQNGERLYAGYKGMIRRFEIERPGKQISQLSTYVKGQASQGTILSCITTSPSMDGVFAVGSYGSGVGLYSDYTNSCDMLIPCDTRFVSCIQYSTDGQKIFIGGRKTNAIECFDIRSTAKLYAKYERKTNTNQRYGFQIDSADRFLFTGDSNGQLLVFDLLSTSSKAEWRIPNVTSSVVSELSLHPTTSLLATAHGQRVFPQPLGSDSDAENNETVKEMDYVEMGKKFDNSLKLWNF